MHPQFHHVGSRPLKTQENISGDRKIRIPCHQKRHQSKTLLLSKLLKSLSDG